MTRIKKSRKAKGFIDEEGPNRRERLADPESYDSRRRKAQQERKKHKSVYEKHQEAEAANANGDKSGNQRQTRLSDKIRRLNAAKEDSASE